MTITVKPDAGYTLGELTVTGPNGKTVAVTDAGNGVYKFQMPAGKVTVAASFSASDGCAYSDHCAAKRFTDVPAASWYHEAVDYVVGHGLMKGASDTTFAPDVDTTRGMLAAILYRREGSPSVGAESAFTDVATNRYDTAAITWASAEGVVTGYGGGLFGPDDALTREQLAAILYRYARLRGHDGSVGADLSAFSDAAQISAYATDAMRWANAAGLITGKGGGLLDPKGNAKRSETAAILMRLNRYLEA
ncbi:S-layer homology domain-containing protein [Agathobaculum sp. NTUH-O15-33]|uniref:S-layer homology domain-containing protein n=1 Tax=Agathobaculum sp. NTUH-O15-33 TaxID=3079302 RepID=UPI002958A4A4|nr:S-layer homology domain-containing protein [Agathobaculum sp. NTUH-O15-33]WNX83965.1 S-layer homology domain-containing protein [Agathobaculum sp. NTUH-O15-33]